MTLRFEEIIKQLEESNLKKDEQFKSNLIFQEKTFENNKGEKTKLISEDKEKEILENLKRFENSQKFTAKGFTISNLTTFLKTNTAYTSYVLRHHRNKTFSEYINSLRIQFVIEKLYKNPEFLGYKINYISHLAGFSSHSKFTQAFKKETEIAPSDFIMMIKTMKNDSA